MQNTTIQQNMVSKNRKTQSMTKGAFSSVTKIELNIHSLTSKTVTLGKACRQPILLRSQSDSDSSISFTKENIGYTIKLSVSEALASFIAEGLKNIFRIHSQKSVSS